MQAPATAIITHLMDRGTPLFVFIALASLGFGAAMLLGSGLPTAPAVIVTIALFTLAEPFFHSTVSTAFAGLPSGTRLEMFNLRQLCWTTGEALGVLWGGAVFLPLHHHGHGRFYWLTLGICALAITTPLIAGRRKRPTRAPVADPPS